MDLNIKGKIAVVTASSKGLGRAVAEALAAEGCNLAVCSRDKTRIGEAADDIRATYNVEVLPVVCDVLKTEDIENLREKTITRFKTCHILFTDAGIKFIAWHFFLFLEGHHPIIPIFQHSIIPVASAANLSS